MRNPTIEVYRGRRPRCLYCGKPLRPNYKATTEPVWLRKVLPEGEDTLGGWDTRYDKGLARWVASKRVERVVSRRFLGTFGACGNGFFCSQTHGFRWAVEQCRNK